MVKHSVEKPVAERSDSKFKGVRKRKWGKWVSEIRLPNSRERIWLGSYDSAEKAARAFDAALFCLRGRVAKFNFPENPPNIAGGRSLSPAEIQEAAARFANSEPQRSQPDRFETDQSVSLSESRAESPCPSVVSDGTVQMEGGELMWDGPFLDMLMNTGSCNHSTEYGIFQGFDDLYSDFFPPSLIPNLDYGEETNLDGVLEQGSFLWNF
jgi:hypothetical protein|uniref:ERF family protein n=1 Tax=Populus trichocarpa TaxID=3694 RepID=A0A2K2A231_POPTR|nr:ERF family protein [Populus trichocarpa]|eukprot:XP_024458985.1 ethylene-responsive transcription factor ERF017 [Populus trichocarpa]